MSSIFDRFRLKILVHAELERSKYYQNNLLRFATTFYIFFVDHHSDRKDIKNNSITAGFDCPHLFKLYKFPGV